MPQFLHRYSGRRLSDCSRKARAASDSPQKAEDKRVVRQMLPRDIHFLQGQVVIVREVVMNQPKREMALRQVGLQTQRFLRRGASHFPAGRDRLIA